MNVNLRGARPQNLHEQQPQLRGVERRGGRRGGRQYAGRRHGPMIEEENSSNSENDDNSSTESDEFAKEAILRANQYERGRPQQSTGENSEFKIKIDVPYFDSTFETEEFLDWL